MSLSEKGAQFIEGIKSEASTIMSNFSTSADPKKRQMDAYTVKHPAFGGGCPFMNTDTGLRIGDTDHWLRVGNRGPSLLEDPHGREKIHKFDHERIPERVVHARGVGAWGHFKLHTAIPEYSHAAVLNDTSQTVPIFLRFSTVLGSRGSADTVRDVRGFAVRFFTEQGNWDIVGNNIPIFFIQDGMKFPDLIHSGKGEPHNEVPTAQTAHDNFWDFVSLTPETTAMTVWAMSDRGIPRSLRMMQGFGVNTYTLINKEGKRHFVKFHFKPKAGVHSLVWDEALKVSGQDPDNHRRDLNENISSENFPEWEFGVQVLPESRENEFSFDILDATKFWPEELVPVKYIGTIQLNRNVDEFFAETEQVAFCTSHVVPGVGFSNDPLLQIRLFSYLDTQLTRLGGPNWNEIPINQPICPVNNNQRDGFGRRRINKGAVNYWPNRFDGPKPATEEEGGYKEYPEHVEGRKVRMREGKWLNHFEQATLFWNSLTHVEQSHVISSYSFELSHVEDEEVRKRIVNLLVNVHIDLASPVAMNLGLEAPKPLDKGYSKDKSAYLSMLEGPNATVGTMEVVKGRKIGLIAMDGFNAGQLESLKTSIKLSGATPLVIANRGNIKSESGSVQAADFTLSGSRSTMFDALVVVGGKQAVQSLSKNGTAIHFVREAYKHQKALMFASPESIKFATDVCFLGISPSPKFAASGSGVVSDMGVVSFELPDASSTLKNWDDCHDGIKKFIHIVSKHRVWDREVDAVAA